MSNHVTDEERSRRIDVVYECIKKGMSTRECAKFLTENYFKISNATVKDYIDRMKYKDLKKYEELKNIINSHKPKTVSDEEVRKRVKNVIVLLSAGYTFNEVAKMLKETKDTVYRDFEKRLNYLTDEELRNLDIDKEQIEIIKESLKERSMENLGNNGKKR